MKNIGKRSYRKLAWAPKLFQSATRHSITLITVLTSVLLIGGPLEAGDLTGQAFQGDDQKTPVAGVKVVASWKGSSKTAVTGPDGTFKLSVPKDAAGPIMLEYKKIGCNIVVANPPPLENSGDQTLLPVFVSPTKAASVSDAASQLSEILVTRAHSVERSKRKSQLTTDTQSLLDKGYKPAVIHEAKAQAEAKIDVN